MDKLKRKAAKQKVLLMGRSGAGKSSMRSVIFHNVVAKDTRKLETTIAVEKDDIKFLGNLMLSIWDCGGQDAFVENYLAAGQLGEKQKVFSGVGVLLYVFDVESREFETTTTNNGPSSSSSKDLDTYATIIQALSECSPHARVFALVHKMDLVQSEYKERVLHDKTTAIFARSGRFQRTIRTYGTSIWDQTLYKAWGMIVHSLIPNLEVIERVLESLAKTTNAEEIILFEERTFLTVTSVKSKVGDRNPYDDRYETLSNILKTFRTSLGTYTNSKTSHPFAEFSIKTTRFNLVIARLTTTTYALVIFPPGEAEFQCARLNILKARDGFTELDGLTTDHQQRPGKTANGAIQEGPHRS